MDITHLIKIRKQYRWSDQKTIKELNTANSDLKIGLTIAIGKLSYCKGKMTRDKKRIKELENELQKIKNNE